MTVSTLTVVPEATASGTAPCAEPPHHTDPAIDPVTEPVRFFLGTHLPHWLRLDTVGMPLFISDRRLRRYRRLPRAVTCWALDSGGFTELSRYGCWDHGPTPAQYVARVRRYRDEVGHLAWAAPQDWMCEPHIVTTTGLTVAEHQRRTVDNYLRLRDLAPELPIIPVVQGHAPWQYLHCADLYARAGIDLTAAALVGVGSICRRQSTRQVGDILTGLHRAGITRLHGFGLKAQGLARWAALLASADSMAWSAEARRRPALPGCLHRSCANCPRHAIAWRHRVLAATARATAQPALFDLGGWDA